MLYQEPGKGSNTNNDCIGFNIILFGNSYKEPNDNMHLRFIPWLVVGPSVKKRLRRFQP
jgi:hypothetical protein